MPDPFRAPANHQLYREAQVGLLVLAGLITIFVYLAIQRIAGSGDALPEHVRNAPVARTIQPDGSPWGFTDEPPPRRRGSNAVAEVQSDGSRWNNQNANHNSVTSLIRDPEVAQASLNGDSPNEKSPALPVSVPDLVLPRIELPERSTVTRNDPLPPPQPDNDPIEDYDSPRSNSFLPPSHELANSTKSPDEVHPVRPFADLATAPKTNQVDLVNQRQSVAEEPTKEQKVDLDSNPRGDSDLGGNVASKDSVESSQPTMTASSPSLPISLDLNPMASPQANKMEQETLQPPQPETSPLEKPHGRHKAVEDDSFYSLAQQYYGDGRYFNALYEFNRQRVTQFDPIPEGTDLEIPSLKELEATLPTLVPGVSSLQQTYGTPGIYVTRSGDTLFGIAREQLGQASRYLEIYQSNRNLLPAEFTATTALEAGLQLKLPIDDCPFIRQP